MRRKIVHNVISYDVFLLFGKLDARKRPSVSCQTAQYTISKIHDHIFPVKNKAINIRSFLIDSAPRKDSTETRTFPNIRSRIYFRFGTSVSYYFDVCGKTFAISTSLCPSKHNLSCVKNKKCQTCEMQVSKLTYNRSNEGGRGRLIKINNNLGTDLYYYTDVSRRIESY